MVGNGSPMVGNIGSGKGGLTGFKLRGGEILDAPYLQMSKESNRKRLGARARERAVPERDMSRGGGGGGWVTGLCLERPLFK